MIAYNTKTRKTDHLAQIAGIGESESAMVIDGNIQDSSKIDISHTAKATDISLN